MNKYHYKNFKILKLTGADATKFLQGLVTSDLSTLSLDNNILLTAFANLKGRIISLSFVKFLADDQFLISVEEEVLEKLQAWLKKYSIFSKINLSIDEKYALFFTKKNFLNHNILCKEELESDISFEEVQRQNILNKLATINKENTEKFLPAELELDNLENVICYTKGCYMGQEIIARMHYRSKFKKSLIVLTSNLDIQNLDLKDSQNKLLATVVNKIFIDNQLYMLVVFHNQTPALEYKLQSGQIVARC